MSLITVCVWQSTLTVIPVALSFGVSDGHRETKLVTVTLTGPFDDSGKVCEHEWSVVHFWQSLLLCVSVWNAMCGCHVPGGHDVAWAIGKHCKGCDVVCDVTACDKHY